MPFEKTSRTIQTNFKGVLSPAAAGCDAGSTKERNEGMTKDMTRSAAKPIAVLASVALCVVLAVFGAAPAAWADEADDVTVNESPDKYTWYVENYVGMNAADVGYTSISGLRYDSYGAGVLQIEFMADDGSYIDIDDEEALSNYVVYAQSLPVNTEIKYTFMTDSSGEEYDNLVATQNYERIVLAVCEVGEESGTAELTQINASPDKYTWYIENYVGMNAANIGYTSISNTRYDSYGEGVIEVVYVADDGTYLDPEDEELLSQYVVYAQSLPANTELTLTFMTDSDGEEYDNLVLDQSYEEIVLAVHKVGEEAGSTVLTQINAADRYTYYVDDYVGRNLAACGYISLSGNYNDAYGSGYVTFTVILEDGTVVDTSDEDALANYVVTAQSVEPNTPITMTYMTNSSGEEYDNLVDTQSVEEITLTVTTIENWLASKGTTTEAATETEAAAETTTEVEAATDAAVEATSDVSATLSVSVHQQDIGWTEGVASGVTAGSTGSDLRVEAIALTLSADVSGSITYSVDCRDYGWTEWASDGATAGVTGESQPITAIKVQLTDEAASAYDVWYRVWVDGYGWTGWAKNGAPAGTTSFDAIIEGIEVVILAAGSSAPGDVAPAVITSSFEADEAEETVVNNIVFTYSEDEDKDEEAAGENATEDLSDVTAEEDALADIGSIAGAIEDATVDENSEEEAATEDDAAAETVEFEEIVVVDNDYCSITITGFDERVFNGVTVGVELQVTLVNKSDSATYWFTVENGVVDGLEDSFYMDADLEPGETSYATITVDVSDCDNMYVSYTDIELEFSVVDWDTFDYVVRDLAVSIYPYGEAAVTTCYRESQETDVVLLDNEYLTITLISQGVDSRGDYDMELYIENKSDYDISLFSWDSTTVNGTTCDLLWTEEVGAGHSCFDTISLDSSDLEDIGITDPSTITSIEIILEVFGSGDVGDSDEVITITSTNS